MRAIVSVCSCADYAQEHVDRAVEESVSLLGGMAAFVRPGDRVVLKINLLQAVSPEAHVTTHPTVVSAVTRLVQQAGGHPVIADSPGAGVRYAEGPLRRTYEKTGMARVAAETGAELNFNTEAVPVSCESGLIRRFEVIRPIIDADVVINLPKAKTHSFMLLTGAVKNLFGVLPGFTKPGYHSKLKDAERFAAMLVDLVDLIQPRLTIMDAVAGMEGNGPSAGQPRHIGAMVAGADPVAVDVVFSAMVGLDPQRLPVIREAARRGMCTGRVEDIEVLGIPLEEVQVPDFRLPDTFGGVEGPSIRNLLLRTMLPLLKEAFSVRPQVMEALCVGCGVCERGCPEGAIRVVEKKARIDYNRCIRCYCCHELCPEKAVALKTSYLNRLFIGSATS